MQVVAATRGQQWLVMGTMGAGMFSLILLSGPMLPAWGAGLLGGGLALGVQQFRGAGRRRLRAHVARLDQEDPGVRAAAMHRLVRLARSRLAVTSVRMEAAGHVALDAVDRGAFGAALEVMRAAARDVGRTERQRLPDQGFLGEAMLAVLGRAFPGRVRNFTRASRIKLAREVATPPHRDFDLVMTALRVLEFASEGNRAAARQQWEQLEVHPGRGNHPGLAALVAAACFERLEDDDGAFGEACRANLSNVGAPVRSSLEQAFPRLRQLDALAYRVPAPVETRALARVPEGLSAVAPRSEGDRWLRPSSTRSRRVAGLVSASLLVQAASLWAMGNVALGVTSTVLSALLLIQPRVGLRVLQARRKDKLLGEGVLRHPNDARWDELAAMPSRTGPSDSDAGALYPLDTQQLRLLVGLRRAEEALEQGDRAEAARWVGWWLDGAVDRGFDDICPVALGSSAVRVAALVGHRAAPTLLDDLRRRGGWDARVFKKPGRRTGHGDAPRAFALARAVFDARRGDLRAASKALMIASAQPAVVLDPFEVALYGAVARKVVDAGLPAPAAFTGLEPGLGGVERLLDDPGAAELESAQGSSTTARER